MARTTPVGNTSANGATDTAAPKFTKGETERFNRLVREALEALGGPATDAQKNDAKVAALHTVIAERTARLERSRVVAKGMTVDGITAEELKSHSSALRDLADVKASVATALAVIETNLSTIDVLARVPVVMDKDGKPTNVNDKGKTPRTPLGEALAAVRKILNAEIAARMVADDDDDE